MNLESGLTSPKFALLESMFGAAPFSFDDLAILQVRVVYSLKGDRIIAGIWRHIVFFPVAGKHERRYKTNKNNKINCKLIFGLWSSYIPAVKNAWKCLG